MVACPKDGEDGAYHYADLDLDLGNSLQDLVGFFVHMGELLNPDRTDHFSFWVPHTNVCRISGGASRTGPGFGWVLGFGTQSLRV